MTAPKRGVQLKGVIAQTPGVLTRGLTSPLGTTTDPFQSTAMVVTWLAGDSPTSIQVSVIARLRRRRQQIFQPVRPGGRRIHLDISHAADTGLDSLDVRRNQLFRDPDLDAEHQLVALAVRFHLLGGELRLRRDEAHVTGSCAARSVINRNPRLRSDRDPGSLLRGKEDLHVDVFEIDQRERFAAGRQDLADFCQAVEDPAADRRLERRVVDAGLDRRHGGLGGLDLLLHRPKSRLFFRHRGLAHVQVRAAAIVLLLRTGAARQQFAGSFQLDDRKVDFALLLDDARIDNRLLLAGARDVRLGFGQFGLERVGVQPDQYPAWFDQVAFVDKNLLDPQRLLRGHVDEFGLDAAVAVGDPLGQHCLQRQPVAVAKEPGSGDGGGEQHPRQLLFPHRIHSPTCGQK